MLECQLDKAKLLSLLQKQLSNFFFLDQQEIDSLEHLFDNVWEKVYNCFKLIDNKYYKNSEGRLVFSPYHSGQYLTFLYLYSYVCSTEGNKLLADKLYYLNKIMHACDIYHEVKLPDSFFFEHPVGTVLGRAEYGNGFFAMQNCTVGANKDKYPKIGIHCKMFSGSKILGNSTIGDHVIIAANAYVKDQDIPSHSIVFGSSPNIIIKPIKLT